MANVPSTLHDKNQRADNALSDEAVPPHMFDGPMLAELRNSQAMADEGISRAKRNVQRLVQSGRQADATPTRHVIRSILRECSARLMDRIENGVGIPGRHRVGENHLVLVADTLGADAVIFTALRTIFNLVPMLSGAHKHAKLVTIAAHIGRRVADEYHWQLYANEHHHQAEELEDHWRREAYRVDIQLKQARKIVRNSDDLDTLDTKAQTQIGVALLDVVRETGPFFVEYTHREGNKTARCIGVTPHLGALIERTVSKFEELYTSYMPTLVPPRAWSTEANLYGGGYWSQSVAPYGIIKRSRPKELIALESHHKENPTDRINAQHHVRAMNALQSTPFEINRDVLEAAEYVRDREMDTGDYPALRDLPAPNDPADWHREEIAREMNRQRAHVHAHNNKAFGRRFGFLKIVSLANRYPGPFYLPTKADHRWRMYYVPSYLQPQGQDLARGLIQFHRGEAIASDQAVQSLYLSVAGACGADKGTLEDRLDWVEANKQELVGYGTNWQANMDWLWKFSDPWQALRACTELAQFDAIGLGYVSRLISYVDGKCNGLQNFGGLTLDPTTCESVCLSDDPLPADIYAQIRDKALELAAELQSYDRDFEMALAVARCGIPRDWAKNVVMVMPYSGTRWATNDNIHNAIHADLAAGIEAPYPDIKRYSRFVNNLIWDALEGTLTKPVQVQQWLRKIAALAVESNTPISWVTPTGAPVKQAEWHSEPYRIKTAFNGAIFSPTLRRQTDQLARARMQNSIAPNLIHSLDSSILTKAIVNGLDAADPITDWVAIHDSFGVHVNARAALLAPDGPLKSAFVETYSRDILADLADTFREQLAGADIPAPPSRGNFDIEEVRNSDYFFS
jgi:DNA-directed RNA polymerase